MLLMQMGNLFLDMVNQGFTGMVCHKDGAHHHRMDIHIMANNRDIRRI
jgi:hypothetical protein